MEERKSVHPNIGGLASDDVRISRAGCFYATHIPSHGYRRRPATAGERRGTGGRGTVVTRALRVVQMYSLPWTLGLPASVHTILNYRMTAMSIDRSHVANSMGVPLKGAHAQQFLLSATYFMTVWGGKPYVTSVEAIPHAGIRCFQQKAVQADC